eukprot:Seg1645.7 transcript_id=Seg1645.7/GoldUCD/mRNA.D3Y31 product="Polycomb group RING finger protein 3" protein_id=Seg1645.7/GoldUCD/D3Y31
MESMIKLGELTEFLSCGLCKGYLIDATAITECLHTFCRSCIVKYLNGKSTCPTCDLLISQSSTFNFIRQDRTKQDLVYKLIPGLKDRECALEAKFYADLGLPVPERKTPDPELCETTECKTEDTPEQKYDPPTTEMRKTEEHIALCLEYDRPKDPKRKLKPLKRKYLKCSSYATVGHIKKFISGKLKLASCRDLDVLCNDEVLGKDHTLKFLSVTRWKLQTKPLLLHYRPSLDIYQ